MQYELLQFKKGPKMFNQEGRPELQVYYDIDREVAGRDDEIEEIAGVKIDYSGTCLSSDPYVRNCGMFFPTEDAMKKAKVELQAAGFRFAAFCPIHPEGDDVE